ncbi:MAG: autotransporter outer membrane beta-barrel domain-containing protein, partial [Brevundimonas sp.]
MRKLLATAAAIAPLLAATGVQAEVVISNDRTTPVTTSGSNDNVRISSAGSIAVTSGTALTLDSNHSIDLDSGSEINMLKSADGSTGILVQGGRTGSVTIGGVVQLTDDVETATDTDKDGDLDGPFATGANRHGVNVVGAAPFTGRIYGETSSNISVEGNQSYGVRVQSDLVGDLDLRGVISVRGTDTYGVRTQGNVTGDVYVAGTVAAIGQNATGASVEGDVSGSVTVQGQLSSTGYRYTTRPSAAIIEKLDADDLLQGGSALVVSGNVAQGVVLARPPVDLDKDVADEDGDGIADASEGTASITTLGSAPAIAIGADDRSITLGVAGTGDNAYGFINQGSVSAAGLYDEVDSTAIAFGGGAGQTVTIAGGIYNNGGTIASTSILGDAVGVDIGAGVTTPKFVNTGSMAAVSSGEGANEVAVVRIAAGANLPTFVNNGPITALGGYESNVTGVQDLSGTLTSFTNTRVIAIANQPDSEEETTGSATAIDLSANTTGVTITQYGVVQEDDGDEDTEPPLDSDDDGVPDAFEPAISGDIKMGSGADFLDIRNGAVIGDMYFGAGQDHLSITGGAVVTGV